MKKLIDCKVGDKVFIGSHCGPKALYSIRRITPKGFFDVGYGALIDPVREKIREKQDPWYFNSVWAAEPDEIREWNEWQFMRSFSSVYGANGSDLSLDLVRELNAWFKEKGMNYVEERGFFDEDIPKHCE